MPKNLKKYKIVSPAKENDNKKIKKPVNIQESSSSEVSKPIIHKKTLEVKGLNNHFKKTHILRDVSFDVLEGGFHGFIGENGAGKTTTMCFIAGILNDYSGEIIFNNKNIKELEEKSILFIPERVEFPNHLSAFEFVKVFSEIFTNKKIPDEKVNKLFELFDILEIKNRKANKLSSGQKKKISLIRSVLSEPKLLLIDEPAANLDPTSRHKLFNSLKKLNERGTTILISSHIISELEKYVDSATMIKKGEIVWTGVLEDKLSNIFKDFLIKGGF